MTSGRQANHYELDLDDHSPLDRITMPEIEVEPETALEIDPRPLAGDQLRAWREACRWRMRPTDDVPWQVSQRWFARLIGVNEHTYNNLENIESIGKSWSAMMRLVFDEGAVVPDAPATPEQVSTVCSIVGSPRALGELLGRRPSSVRAWRIKGAPPNACGWLMKWVSDDLGV